MSYSDIAAQPSTWVNAWVKVPDKLNFGAPVPAGLDLVKVKISRDKLMKRTFQWSEFVKAACGRFGFLKIFHNPADQKNFHLTLRVTDSRFLHQQVSVSIENFRDGCHEHEGHADCVPSLSEYIFSTNLEIDPQTRNGNFDHRSPRLRPLPAPRVRI